MIFFPLLLDPDHGFTLPSYNARQAVKRIAQTFVSGSLEAKPVSLRQKLRPRFEFSAQVLVMGDKQTMELISDTMRANIATVGDIYMEDPSVKAWIRIDEDTPTGDNPLFIVRAEEDLIARTITFFQGFINVAKTQGDN